MGLLWTICRTLAFAFIWLLVVCTIKGLDALSGVSRLSGPLRGCQAIASFYSSVAANRTTDENGTFNVSAGQRPDDVVRVTINPGASCLDIFTNLMLPFQLAAALPANAAAGSVGYGSFMGLSYLELVAAAANDTNNSTATNRPSTNTSIVRQAMTELYGSFNISLAAYQLDPLQLQPLSLVRSANATTRALAVAILAADVEMGALTALGAALLNASAPAAAGTAANSGGAAAARMTTFARAVAAEGAWKLMQLEALRQELLADAAAAANATQGAPATLGNSTRDPSPPAPPAPPPPPSAATVGGLYSADVVASILDAASRLTNVTLLPNTVNATAAVVAGMAAFAEVVKDVALLEVEGLQVGLNPLNALITMTRLAAVQADAAAQMSELVGPNPSALATYVLDALPERISKATANLTAIHAFLGLPPPPAAVPCGGAAHVVGPLAGCSGQANGVWDAAYGAFVTTGGSTLAGALSLSSKGTGTVAVTPYRACLDSITTLQLSMSVSNLGPAMDAVSVSPVAMLAQGLYTLEASRELATITLSQQTAAFAAMGLNLTAYNAFMILPPSAAAANLSANSSSPRPNSSSSRQTFNLSHPLMGSVMAANAQLVGLVYATRAMFATSCKYAYDMDGEENANTFTATLTLYAAAMQAVASGGVLNLTRAAQLENVFGFVATACFFNSSWELQKGNPSATHSGAPAGTFLSGGSAAAVGATSHTIGRRRRRSTLATPGALSGAFTAPRHHRRLRAELFAAGITGPEALRLLPARPRDPVPSSGPELDSYSVPDPVPRLEQGLGAGEGPAAGLGTAAGHSHGQSGGRDRILAVYVDDPDSVIVYTKVAEVLSGINARLSVVQATSTAAAAGLPRNYSSSASSSATSTYNLTDLVTTAAELGYVAQNSFYSELDNAMDGSYSSGLTLVVAVQAIAARYTGAALQQRMAEAPINRALICSAKGAQCASSPSPLPSPPWGGAGGKKSNAMLYAGVGVSVVLVVVALLLGVWLARRAVRKRQVKLAVVNNFKSGDHMHNMALRLPSTLPPDGPQLGNGAAARQPPQSQTPDVYQSLVPAALGSDPTVALDYPLYPAPLNASVGAYYHQHQQHLQKNSKLSSNGGAGGGGGGGSGKGLLNTSLPPPRFPPPPPADRGNTAQGPAASLPPSQQQLQQQAQQYQQQSAQSYGAGGYKTYANSAYMSVRGGRGGSDSDAAAPRDNHSGNTTGGSNTSTRSLLGGVQQHHQQQQQHVEGAGLPPMTPPPPGLYGIAGKGNHISEGGPSGPGGGAAALLNGSLGGARRSGLPPLAQYTTVTNTAAPTAALNASMRTIPVNINFNSSLRPPPTHGPSNLSGRQAER